VSERAIIVTYLGHEGGLVAVMVGGVPRRAALRRRRRARHGRHRGPGHLPVPLHVLELHREPLRRRRRGLLVPHAELGHGRRPLPALGQNQGGGTSAITRLQSSSIQETSKTHRGVALRRGGARARRRPGLAVVPLRMRGAVAAAAAASARPVRGLGLVLVVVAVVVLVVAAMVVVLLRRRLWARPLLVLVVVLRRRRELALLGGPAARVGRRAAAAAVGPPVVVSLLRLPAVARGRRPRGRRRGDAHHGPLLGVVGVERPVQRRRGGALVLAHLVEVGRVPDIVFVPGAELGHVRPILQQRPGVNNPSFFRRHADAMVNNMEMQIQLHYWIVTHRSDNKCTNDAIKSHSDG